jgi:hypothetical protein
MMLFYLFAIVLFMFMFYEEMNDDSKDKDRKIRKCSSEKKNTVSHISHTNFFT